MANLLVDRLERLVHNSVRPMPPSPIGRRSKRRGSEAEAGRSHGDVRDSTDASLVDQTLITELQPVRSPQQSALKVAVIVPYYQREGGILRRCLASIFAQKVDPTIGIHVIIVDDASPRPTEEELRGIQIPDQMAIDVITRNNGGPAAARNSGLDYVCERPDFVAFIDSDDTWRDDHIQRAIDALGNSNDLYFADHLHWAGFSNLDTKEFGALLRAGQSITLQPLAEVRGVWLCSSAYLIPYAVNEFIAHTSSLVYRTSKLFTCRFDEDMWYGEDDLFFLDLLSSSTKACVSTETEVELGLGENVYFGSLSWDSKNNIRRCYYQIITLKRIRSRYQLSFELCEMVTRFIRAWRVELTFFILRQLLKGRAVPLNVFSSLLREDPLFFALFPVNSVRTAVQWALGKLQGKHPLFH